jgi:hypothetical protein
MFILVDVPLLLRIRFKLNLFFCTIFDLFASQNSFLHFLLSASTYYNIDYNYMISLLFLRLMFIRMSVSLRRFFLIKQSKGVSVEKLGVWFTSSRYGLTYIYNNIILRCQSRKTSNPRISKHMLFA